MIRLFLVFLKTVGATVNEGTELVRFPTLLSNGIDLENKQHYIQWLSKLSDQVHFQASSVKLNTITDPNSVFDREFNFQPESEEKTTTTFPLRKID